MKIYVLLAALALATPACTACGHSTTDSELTGQVKKVVKVTPLICPDYVEADISMGVMRNGVGSMSHDDMTLRVMNPTIVPELQKASRDGSIVRITYDKHRVAVCYPALELTGFEVEVDPAVGSGSASKP